MDRILKNLRKEKHFQLLCRYVCVFVLIMVVGMVYAMQELAAVQLLLF